MEVIEHTVPFGEQSRAQFFNDWYKLTGEFPCAESLVFYWLRQGSLIRQAG